MRFEFADGCSAAEARRYRALGEMSDQDNRACNRFDARRNTPLAIDALVLRIDGRGVLELVG
jgi:hypothetical protein